MRDSLAFARRLAARGRAEGTAVGAAALVARVRAAWKTAAFLRAARRAPRFNTLT